MKRFLLIANPNAGGSKGAAAAAEAQRGFETAGVEVELALTERADHAPEIVVERGGNFDAIIGIGGDGTANEIARGLRALGAKAPAFSIIPLGTANVLAMELGLGKLAPNDAATLLASAQARTMPYAVATFSDDSREYPVIVNVGIGFDARVVHRVAAARRKSPAKFSKNRYMPQGMKEIWAWRAPRLQVQIDGVKIAREASAFVACNTKNYGGVMTLTPQADLFAVGMDLCIRFGRGRGAILRHLLCAKRGREDASPHAEYRRVRSFEIRSSEPEAVQIDGDDVGFTPLRAKMAAVPLQILVPQHLEA
ncbi:MAG: YegS/Rv2252/BmrU family lipid kinase [Planctomycetota bacterium]